MKLEVCFVEGDISKRTLCEEVLFSAAGGGLLFNSNKPSTIVQHQDIVWIRPYAAQKRVRKSSLQ